MRGNAALESGQAKSRYRSITTRLPFVIEALYTKPRGLLGIGSWHRTSPKASNMESDTVHMSEQDATKVKQTDIRKKLHKSIVYFDGEKCC